MRVAYTLEQCWHRVPGGSAIAALRLAQELNHGDDMELIGVAGRHRRPPDPAFQPNIAMRWLPVGRPLLYETWNRLRWPLIESVTGDIDVCHSTVAIPAVTRRPHVVTIHDVAFIHTPERFTSRGVRAMTAGLQRCREVEICCVPSEATRRDLIDLGFDDRRIRVVPWGVDTVAPTADEIAATRARFDLPSEFVLFVGTLEPRKNLSRLAQAVARLDTDLPLVIAGASGWGDAAEIPADVDSRFVGFVAPADLRALYALATVFAYPSLQEGFGMPVLEAMAQGTPVVTSCGTSTEEAAGGAAVLVDPHDPDSIAAGLTQALGASTVYAERGRERAAAATWELTAQLTAAAYRDACG